MIKRILLVAVIALAGAGASVWYMTRVVRFECDGLPCPMIELPRADLARDLGYPRQFKKAITFQPVYDDRRKMAGFEITKVTEGSVVDQMGLRPKDVILEVAGVKLDAPIQPFKAFQQARATGVAQVKMRRGALEHTFVVRGAK